MSVKERREREKLETRDKILDAARELFVTEGYDGVSMRAVAERIEYSPAAIYVHFADKDELFRELVHADFAKLAGAFQDFAKLSDPVERIKQTGLAYIEFGRRFPNHYTMMFMTPCPLHEPELDACDYAIKGNPEVDAYAFLKHSVQQAIDAGLFRDELKDAELLSQTLWAAVHGVISLQIAKHGDAWVDWRPIEQRAQLTLDATLRGLLKEKS